MSSYTQLVGTSGAGKGTRVSQLLLFLCSKYDSNIIYYEDDKVKKSPAAIEIPKIKLMIPGKITRSNKGTKMMSLTGLDIMQSLWGDTDIVEYLFKKYSDYNIICEGYVGVLGSYYSPKNIQETFGFAKQMWCYYIYPNHEVIQERVVGRSGKRIKGSCFSHNEGFNLEYDNQVIPQANEMNNNDMNITHSREDVSVCHTLFGEVYLEFVGLSSLIEDYKLFCTKVSTKRHVLDFQDRSIFPKHLHSYEGDANLPVNIEEYNLAISTLHPSEPKSVHIDMFKKLKSILGLNPTSKLEYHTSIASSTKIDLPRYHVTKRHIDNMCKDTQFDDLQHMYHSIINKFRALENT